MKTIVISAVSLRKGGTLTILRNCLEYLSRLVQEEEYRVVALVHKRELAFYPGIEYIEMPQVINNWGRRLWCEYVTMYRISNELSPVYLWLSLHDTTPRVRAERRAVYCQTSFPFLHLHCRDILFDYKICLFGLLTRFAYRINIRHNKYLIVQAEWLRKGFSQMFKLDEEKFIVSPPEQKSNVVMPVHERKTIEYTFLFASTADCHKNFELLCQAAELLENEIGKKKFKVILTITGLENKYSRWLYSNWRKTESLNFAGFMNKAQLYDCYAKTDCLIFPSRIETWGLPISEYLVFGKPMLLADLPYAHETACGSMKTAFFDPCSPHDLMRKMKQLVLRDESFLYAIKERDIPAPLARTWKDLFDMLLR